MKRTGKRWLRVGMLSNKSQSYPLAERIIDLVGPIVGETIENLGASMT
jgi:hypothetical protein